MVVWCAAIAAFVLSLLGTALSLRWALKTGLLDVPNARSAHDAPTPRGGGSAIVLASSIVLGLLVAFGHLEVRFFLALGIGGLLVAGVGYLDDRRNLSPIVRLAAHVGAALWAIFWLGGMPQMQWGQHLVDLGSFGYVIGVLGVVWALNLFNFMDGIDGLAASESAFVCVAGSLIASSFDGARQITLTGAVVGSASLAFLAWNWAPAKIFMGDVGSGFLGFIVALLAVAQGHEDPGAIWIWLTLGAAFLVDATVTLLRRLARRERIHEAHRTHAYQWLARRWKSHAKVSTAAAGVNLFWLLPCALLGAAFPQFAAWIFLIASMPIIIGVVAVGAGRSEATVARG